MVTSQILIPDRLKKKKKKESSSTKSILKTGTSNYYRENIIFMQIMSPSSHVSH